MRASLPSPVPRESPDQGFVRAAADSVRELRAAILGLASAAGADLLQPQDVSRRFALDKTLTWKVARVVRDEHGADAVLHMPGRRRMSMFVTAMTRAGAPESLAAEVWRTFDAFEHMVETHSGDRGTLDVMVATPRNRTSEKRLELIRKNGFLANAAVWGVRARLQMSTHMIAPHDDRGTVAAITICGFLELQRLRENQPWAVANAQRWDHPDNTSNMAPLHADGWISGGPVLPEFCTSPLPLMREQAVNPENRRYELAPGPVGRNSAVDIVLGWRWPSQDSIYETRPGELGQHAMRLSTPVEAMSLELWVHRSFASAIDPTMRLYSMLPSGPVFPGDGLDAGILPLHADVVDLGTGLAGAASQLYPRNPDLVRFGAERMGHDASAFHGFRVTLKYPPIPTMAVIMHPLMKREG